MPFRRMHVSIGPPWVEEAFRDFTGLGGEGMLGRLTTAAFCYLLLMGQRRMALYVAGPIVGGLLVSVALKTHLPPRATRNPLPALG